MASRDENKRVLLYHTRKEDKTIADFVERQKLIGITANDVFDDNRDLIFTQMSVSDKEAYKEKFGSVPASGSDLNAGMILPLPCVIKVCPYNITAETAINNTNWHVPNNNFYAFADEEVQKIFESPAYSTLIDKRNCDVEVIGWFKQANVFGTRGKRFNNVKGAWFDLSRFVISLNSSSGQNGGSFVVRFPILGFAEKLTGYQLAYNKDTKDWDVYSDLGFGGRSVASLPIGSLFQWGDQYYGKKPLKTAQLNNLFSALISYNDLIFISFVRNEDTFTEDTIDKHVAKNTWDMIGLVDDVRVSVNGASGNGFVEITGRDLMKLLIEDGSYFFNPSSAYSDESIFANEAQAAGGSGVYKSTGDIRDVTDLGSHGHGLVRRLRNMSNEIDIFAYKPMREIIYILKGVVSQLSNIEVVPGEIFIPWEDKRTLWKDISVEEEK